jgi:AraC-like DNA-binding protein
MNQLNPIDPHQRDFQRTFPDLWPSAPGALTPREPRRVRIDLTGLEITLLVPPCPATEVTAAFTQGGELRTTEARASRTVVQVPIDPRFLERLREAQAAFEVRPATKAEIRKLCAALLAATGMSPKIARLYEISLAAAILARLAEADGADEAWTARLAALPKWRLRRVTAYIDEHIEDPIRLADLARAAGLTPMYFAAQFRLALGMPPHLYVQHRRINRAQELLRDPTQALVEIALSVGFQTQAHFTTVFGRLTGATPHRWRCAQAPKSNAQT